MAHPSLCLTFWLFFLAVKSTLSAKTTTLYVYSDTVGNLSIDTCIYIKRAGVAADMLCNDYIEVVPGVTYLITAGFPRGTIQYSCLKPKWQQEWTVSLEYAGRDDPDVFFTFKADYCIYAETKADGSDRVLLTCINECYNGPALENPFWALDVGHDNPEWVNPDHGTHSDRYQDRCKKFSRDQTYFKSSIACRPPTGDPSKTSWITTPDVTAEDVGKVDLTAGSDPPLLAANSYFTNPSTITENNNLLSSAQPDMLNNPSIVGDANAQTQNWLTNPDGDLMKLLNLGKRARKSPRGFR